MTIIDDGAEGQYVCPSCEKSTKSDTIGCEECGEWYHFVCVSLSSQAARQIQSEVPFICLLCNDSLLYAPTQDDHLDQSIENGTPQTVLKPDTQQKSVLTPQDNKTNHHTQNNTPTKVTQNKSKPRKSANNNVNKKASLSDQQETISPRSITFQV